jgi:hypothetical protein
MLTCYLFFHTSFSTKSVTSPADGETGLSGGKEDPARINDIGCQRRGGRAGPVSLWEDINVSSA